MLSREDNELVTRTGPGTPAGALLRRFWQPAALVEELSPRRPVKAVRLLGEDLVLFRDEQGRLGLIGRRCPHRGTDLAFGRLEDGGLRCVYHGWLFDVAGRCREQPAEPEGSRFHEKVRHVAYPCREVNGIVFAYLGPGTPPPLPALDCFVAPPEYTFAFKGYLECNWLQALEGGIDPAHVSFLHRFFDDDEPAGRYGKQFREDVAGAGVPLSRIAREYFRPRIEVEPTPYGLRILALRGLGAGRVHVRVTNLVFPNAIAISLGDDMVITQWHVPIDDEHSWWYDIFHSYRAPVDRETMRRDRLELYTLPDYRPRRNRANDYGYDPEEQRTRTYTGMGFDINTHDTFAQESPGPIHDRTREHLGYTDRAITAYRTLLLRAIRELARAPEAPVDVPGLDGSRIAGPIAVDLVAPEDAWAERWRAHDRARRLASPWATPLE